MSEVISQDGSPIVFERQGCGPPMILVDGALSSRGSSPNDSLAEELAPHYTVFTYDRRGRGQSRDTHPYSPEREVEDLDALVAETGGSAHVYGISSGAEHRVLEGQMHIVKAKALAPVLLEFFASARTAYR